MAWRLSSARCSPFRWRTCNRPHISKSTKMRGYPSAKPLEAATLSVPVGPTSTGPPAKGREAASILLMPSATLKGLSRPRPAFRPINALTILGEGGEFN
jgi:hypothetical protein